MLTYIQINAAKPREKAWSLSDSQGLLLIIQPNGSKLWRFRYRFLDKQKTLHLGGCASRRGRENCRKCDRCSAKSAHKLNLDAPLSRWMPEAGGLRVLRSPQSDLDDVVPVQRPPTLFDLMTHTAGFAWGKGLDLPICRAMDEATGTTPFVPYDSDRLVARICALPLVCQPGTRWHYSNGSDLLGVIVSRAAGMSLPAFLAEAILAPLAMHETAFTVTADRLDRLAVGYERDPAREFAVHDDSMTGFWSRSPIFPAGGGGLVSTLDNYLAFARMLLKEGQGDRQRILSEHSVRLMTTNRLLPSQLVPLFPQVDFLRGQGFGLGLSVRQSAKRSSPSETGWPIVNGWERYSTTFWPRSSASRRSRRSRRRNRIALSDGFGARQAGSFSWPGGYGTTWFADPARDLVAILATQVWQDHLTGLSPAFDACIQAQYGHNIPGNQAATM